MGLFRIDLGRDRHLCAVGKSERMVLERLSKFTQLEILNLFAPVSVSRRSFPYRMGQRGVTQMTMGRGLDKLKTLWHLKVFTLPDQSKVTWSVNEARGVLEYWPRLERPWANRWTNLSNSCRVNSTHSAMVLKFSFSNLMVLLVYLQ